MTSEFDSTEEISHPLPPLALGKKKRVLIIDDHPRIGQPVTLFSRSMGI